MPNHLRLKWNVAALTLISLGGVWGVFPAWAKTPMIELGTAAKPGVRLDLKVRSDTDSARWCRDLQGLILRSRPEATILGCGVEFQGQLSNTDYRVELTLKGAEPGDSTQLRITNPREQGGLPMDQLHWPLNEKADSNDLSKREALQQALNNFFEVEKRERSMKELLLVRGVSESREVRLSERGLYEDSSTGEQLSFDAAYEAFMQERSENRQWLKASVQIAAVLGVGAIWYYWDKEFNAQDWEYTMDWAGIRRKVREGIKFDTNPMKTNSPLHPLAGAFYFGFSRGNGLNSMQSLLMSFAGSALWELIVEYREAFSVNDMILTPLAGAAIGEAMHQIRLLLERSSGSFGHKVLLTAFGGPSAVDHWLSNNQGRAPQAKSLNEFGLPDDIHHGASLYFGAAHFDRDTSYRPGHSEDNAYEARLNTEITAIPGYLLPGERDHFIWDTTQTELQAQVGLSPQGLENFYFFVKAAWAGYHHQSIQKDAAGRLSGYSFLVGPSTQYSHSIRKLSDGSKDEIGIVNVLGTSMDLVYFAKGVKIRLKMDVHGDFAAVHSLAVTPFEEKGGTLAYTKKVLAQQGYYFAFGMTYKAKLTAEYEFIELGLEHSRSSLRSIEGMDRYQKEVTDDFPLEDEVAFTRLWMSTRLPFERMRLFVSYSLYQRSGRLDSQVGGSSSAGHTESATMIGVEYVY